MHPDPVDELVAVWRAELPDVIGRESELVKRVMLMAAALNEATEVELPALGLTPAEFDVLAALRRAGEPYARKSNELTRSLMLSSGGTSNVVNRLVTRGLVERRADDRDGRATWVVLTGAGVVLAEKAVRATAAAHAGLLAGVSEESLTAAADALRAVFEATPGTRRPGAPAARRPRRPSPG